jgi:hypothetical protein
MHNTIKMLNFDMFNRLSLDQVYERFEKMQLFDFFQKFICDALINEIIMHACTLPESHQ